MAGAMYNQGSTQNSNNLNAYTMPNSGGMNIIIPSKPQAQRPSEFASELCNQAGKLNSQIRDLRYRLFGEMEPEPSPNKCAVDAASPSLENLIQSAHFSLNEAIALMEVIQNRL